MDLTSYRTVGRSGLIVSPLALGTMTFGAERWGAGEKASRALFDAYVDAGGNFIDTADVSSAGRSEEMLGNFVADAGRRDRLVIATKSGFSRGQGTCGSGSRVR
jgi:aryl-alcohol dehydrogenase-like predicted oxidoreductase